MCPQTSGAILRQDLICKCNIIPLQEDSSHHTLSLPFAHATSMPYALVHWLILAYLTQSQVLVAERRRKRCIWSGANDQDDSQEMLLLSGMSSCCCLDAKIFGGSKRYRVHTGLLKGGRSLTLMTSRNSTLDCARRNWRLLNGDACPTTPYTQTRRLLRMAFLGKLIPTIATKCWG